MENTELSQIKEAIELMNETIGSLIRVVERLSGRPVDESVAERLTTIDKAKNEALSSIDFLDSTGRL